MIEARFEDTIIGDCLLSFDGRIAERFSWRESAPERLHIAMLVVEIGEPNRKGVREVWCTAHPNKRGGGFRLAIADADWPTVEPVIAAITAALQP